MPFDSDDDAEPAFFTHHLNGFILGVDFPSLRILAAAVLCIILGLGAASYLYSLQYSRRVIPEDRITSKMLQAVTLDSRLFQLELGRSFHPKMPPMKDLKRTPGTTGIVSPNELNPMKWFNINREREPNKTAKPCKTLSDFLGKERSTMHFIKGAQWQNAWGTPFNSFDTYDFRLPSASLFTFLL